MRYFGVPTCPYCKKRVNLIRTWSLKRQGEYQCPRCGGISNIFLSPLVYVLALLAIFSGGAMYFFHKFVLDDISIDTAVYVFVPFAIFFLFSLFMVYLEKPVIKKVSREEYMKKRHIRSAVDGSAGAAPRPEARRDMDDEADSYPPSPRASYRPGPAPEAPRQGVVNQAAFSRAKLQAAAENTQQSGRLSHPVQSPRQQPVRSSQPAQNLQPARSPQPRQQRPAGPSAVQGARPRQPAGRPAPAQQIPPAQSGGYTPLQPVPQRRPQGQNAAPRRDIK